MRQILWGLYKKIVIADTCAIYVDDIFKNYSDYSGGSLAIGAVLFSFQIYCDFSGYSDIAIGTAKLFGVDLMENFKTPYFSRNISEFWRRWHISLSTWFKDYLYIPLGGSKKSKLLTIRNIFIIFLVSGFWHGANWTYVFWGAINACYFIPEFLIKRNRKYLTIESERFFPSFREFFSILLTFCMTAFAWIFFRSSSIQQAFDYIKGLFNTTAFFNIKIASTYSHDIRPLIIYLVVFILIDWYYRNSEVVFLNTGGSGKKMVFRYSLYIFIVVSIIMSFNNEANSFIYFQF